MDSLREVDIDDGITKLVEDLVSVICTFILLNCCCLYILTYLSSHIQRKEVAADIAEANKVSLIQYPDVSSWPIEHYNIPQQEDT